MWSLNRFERPAWSTGILIPASFLCGIASAVFIWRGGQKTKRTKEVEERLRLALKIEQYPEQFRTLETRDNNVAAATQAPPAVPASSDNTREERGTHEDGNEKELPVRLDPIRDDESSVIVDEKMVIPPDIKDRD